MSRTADHPIDPLFLKRWSPRAMSGEPLSTAELMTLCEAARWAPSSGNSQPWRIAYARRETPEFASFFDLLEPGNQVWCARAAVLLVVASRGVDDQGRRLGTHSFDTGAAWMSLALQGTLLGLVVHAMAGFDSARAGAVVQLPAEHTIECMVAIGRPGARADLPESLRAREEPNGRRPIGETLFEGGFGPRRAGAIVA
jgi:nitroreductase